MHYGDVGVIDISRNLLLIMSNRQHVTQNNDVTYLSYSKYWQLRTQGTIYILNGFSDLQGILSKLFMLSILGTTLHTVKLIFLGHEWLRNHLSY
jgi:hypothetical protein